MRVLVVFLRTLVGWPLSLELKHEQANSSTAAFGKEKKDSCCVCSEPGM